MTVRTATVYSNPSFKRQRMEQRFPQQQLIQGHFLIEISPFLTRTDIGILEQVSQDFYTCTGIAWKKISKRDQLGTEWHDAENTSNKEKNNYLISLLFSKIFKYNIDEISLSEAVAINNQFGHFPQFPHLHAFVELVVGRKRNFPFLCSPELLKTIRHISDISFEGYKNNKWSGDMLLQGIITILNPTHEKVTYLNETDNIATDYFIAATKLGGIVVNVFGYLIPHSLNNNNCFDLVVAFASKDFFIPMEIYLDKHKFSYQELVSLKESYGSFLPLLAHIAMKTPQSASEKAQDYYLRKCDLIFKVISKYFEKKESPPTCLFEDLFLAQVHLRMYKDVIMEGTVNALLNHYNSTTFNPELCYDMSLVKFKNKKFAAAKEILDKRKANLNDEKYLLLQGSILLALNLNSEAEKFFKLYFKHSPVYNFAKAIEENQDIILEETIDIGIKILDPNTVAQTAKKFANYYKPLLSEALIKKLKKPILPRKIKAKI